MESVLDFRPTLVMSALFATWLAVALLTVLVLYLQVRVARLEAGRSAAAEDPPFKGLVGRLVPELLASEHRPRAVVFLSTACRTCANVLDDLKRHRWRQPVAVAWTDTPAPPIRLALRPAGARGRPGHRRLRSASGSHRSR